MSVPMQSSKPLPPAIAALMSVWTSGQELLPKVVRWGKWHEKQGTTRQDSLQHSYSLSVYAQIFILRMKARGVDLDSQLLTAAVSLHDHGEGELKSDTLYDYKTDEKDLMEYYAFVGRFKELPEFPYLHRAYLLQYASKQPAIFPSTALEEMRWLCGMKKKEVFAFEILERTDYLWYPIQEFQKNGNRNVLAHVVNRQWPHLKRLSAAAPDLMEDFWTSDLVAWCEEMSMGGNPAVPE